MVSFSEMLSQLMEERDIRVFDLARYLGADRSSVYKIVRGTRTPSNRKMVERIADYLCLGHAEKSDLIDSYYYTILKPNHYFASKQIVGLFNRLGQEPGGSDMPYQESWEALTGETMSLRGSDDIQNAIYSICMTAGQRKDKKLRIYTAGCQSVATYTLDRICRFYPGMTVEHIVALDDMKRVRPDHRLYNISCLGSLLPLSMRYANYHLRNIYTNIGALENLQMHTTELVITDEYACCFDSGLSRGFLISNPEIRRTIVDIFGDIEADSHEFISRVPPERLFDVMKNFTYDRPDGEEEEKNCYIFTPSVCGIYLLRENDTLAERHLRLPESEKSRFLAQFQSYLPQEKSFLQKSGMVQLCTRQGIEYFTDSGLINEFNPLCMTPLSPAERLEMLRRWRAGFDRGEVTMVDLPDLKGSAQIEVTTQAGNTIVQVPSAEGTILMAVISEAGLASLFLWFFEFIAKEYRMDAENVHAFLDTCEAKLKNGIEVFPDRQAGKKNQEVG